MKCSVLNCVKLEKARGWCSAHYARWLKYGDVSFSQNERHGLKDIPEYYIWASMKQRCYDKNSRSYPTWGGRGITVCERWRNSFLAFYGDMGARPTPVHTLDRLDNSKEYSKENCGWRTRREQNNNRRDNVRLTAFGRTLTVAQWSRETGLKDKTIYMRLKRGKQGEDALIKLR